MSTDLKEAVRDKYAAMARSGDGSVTGTRLVAAAFGYSEEELASIPEQANLGLSCGNPTAMASLRTGEVVLDLGCGGGLDVFLAAQRVGPTGKAIGVDMTPDMIDRARRNAAKSGLPNVEFHLGDIEALPIPAGTVDCVISNCVLNLVPDKRKAFAEIFRILKPGGRLAVSDIALKQTLPEELAGDLYAYVGCIAGAISFEEYAAGLTAAGFTGIQIVDSKSDLNAYALADNQVACCSPSANDASPLALLDEGCCTPAPPNDADLHARLADLLRKYNVNDYAASVKVFAVKPM